MRRRGTGVEINGATRSNYQPDERRDSGVSPNFTVGPDAGRAQPGLPSHAASMLSGSGLSPTTYSATLIGWATQPGCPSGLTLGAGNLRYLYGAATARSTLTGICGWTISDLGAVSPSDTAMTWNTAQVAAPGDPTTTITLPLLAGGQNVSVDWGDGSSTVVTGPADATHTYAAPGSYTTTWRGLTDWSFRTAGASDRLKLIEVSQWADLRVDGSGQQFEGTANMIVSATDTLDVSPVTSMERMFAGARRFNQDIGAWNTSNVTTMAGMFDGAVSFNRDIGSWNTSSVISMADLLNGATAFDHGIGAWNVQSVTDMTGMLDGSGLSPDAYSDTLIGWAGGPACPIAPALGASGLQFLPRAAAARAFLTSACGLTITDAGELREPDAPTPVGASAVGPTSIRIAWTAPGYDGGAAITAYTARTADGDTCTTTSVAPATPATTCDITGLAPATTYAVTITATNRMGTSAASAAISTTTAALPPPGDQAPAASAGPAAAATRPSVLRITTPRVTRRAITTSFRATGPGRATIVGTYTTRRHGKAAVGVRACHAALDVRRPGTVRLACRLSDRARALSAKHALTVRLVTTFTPAGGTRITTQQTVRLGRR